MHSVTAFPADAQRWLDEDYALLNDAAGFRALVDRPDLQIGRRPMAGDPNDLFRWRLARVAAPAAVVFEGFVHRLLDYHREWTREYAGGHEVERLAPNARVVYQRFDPGIPGISKRDLCSLEIVRDLGPGEKLASFRSVDHVPPAPGHERIDWWGAALCRDLPGGAESELLYLDRENQGGLFPAWLMNRMMTKYLVLQAEAVQRFFAQGGPPELRRGGGR